MWCSGSPPVDSGMPKDDRTREDRPASENLTLERLRTAVARLLAEEPEIAVAYAYGSRMAGKALPTSDLDIALVLRGEEALVADPLLAERIAGRIASELRTSIEIDAHVASHLPLPVRGRVVTEGVLLYDSDPARRVEFETSTRRLYFDFLPFIERDAREALLRGG